MGEYPALSDQDIATINLQQRLRLESGVGLDDLTIAVEFPAT